MGVELNTNYAIILASGSGTRFGVKSAPKHLTRLKDNEIINWTLSSIFTSRIFSQIVVVTKPNEIILTKKVVAKLQKHYITKINFTNGSERRILSFFNGLDFLSSNFKIRNRDNIFLFDANRPLTSKEQLRSLAIQSSRHGCACLARTIVNGIARVSNKSIIQVPQKNEYVEFVTPESIRYQIIESFDRANLQDSLVEIALASGVNPIMVPSTDLNTKLTFTSDLSYLEGLVIKNKIKIFTRKKIN